MESGLPLLTKYLRDPATMRLPRTKSKELENPFRDVTSWPPDAPPVPVVRISDPNTAFFYNGPTNQDDLTFYDLHMRIVVGRERCADIEKATRRQSLCPDWKLHRSGRITSTFAKRDVTAMSNNMTGKEGRRLKLAMDIWKPADLSNISAVKRGRLLEGEAVDFFTTTMKERGYIAQCFLIGFVIHPVFSWFGASPDRIVKITREESGESRWVLLEVKTFDALKPLEDLPYLARLTGSADLTLHRNHAHCYQIQSALLATGFDSSYVMVYGSRESRNLQEVMVDFELRDRIYSKWLEFYFAVLLPEIRQITIRD